MFEVNLENVLSLESMLGEKIKVTPRNEVSHKQPAFPISVKGKHQLFFRVSKSDSTMPEECIVSISKKGTHVPPYGDVIRRLRAGNNITTPWYPIEPRDNSHTYTFWGTHYTNDKWNLNLALKYQGIHYTNGAVYKIGYEDRGMRGEGDSHDYDDLEILVAIVWRRKHLMIEEQELPLEYELIKLPGKEMDGSVELEDPIQKLLEKTNFTQQLTGDPNFTKKL